MRTDEYQHWTIIELVAYLLHELRGPSAAAMGRIQILQDHCSVIAQNEAQLREMLELLSQDIRTIHGLTNLLGDWVKHHNHP